MFGKISEYNLIFMNAIRNILSSNGSLKTEGRADEGIKTEQASKDKNKTVGNPKTKNKHKSKQIDVTATKRARSHHSRLDSKESKPGKSKDDS
jgi:hypothetical protein